MKAIVFEQIGPAEDVLAVRDVDAPVPGPGQVLIKVAVRPIHPADLLFIAGRYRVKPVFPQVAGFDGAGTVAGCGPGVTGFEPGTRVAFRSPGSWAEFAVAPVSRVYRVLPNVADAPACQFPLNPLTAWGLLDECGLAEGARVLATAGRSVVARILAALTRRRKLQLILLARDDAGFVAMDGGSGKIVSTGADVPAVLQGLLKTGRFHAILDAVGGEATVALMDALEPGGRLVSYGVLDDQSFTIRASMLLYRNLVWQGFGIDGWLDRASADRLEAAQRELWDLLSKEPDLMPVIAQFGLKDVRAAIRAMHEAHRPGKVLLV